MRKIITFDLDGVIFPLVQYICARHGIDFQKVTCHNINHCSLLTREEQLTIIGEFGKRETYEHCGLSAGAEKLGKIAKLADVYVNSWCLGEDEGIKREILHNLAPDIPDDNMVFRRKRSYTQTISLKTTWTISFPGWTARSTSS